MRWIFKMSEFTHPSSFISSSSFLKYKRK
ncbi:hypothetical protein DFA_05825 [Cavenderia fasciculata]|uniref:Uncharacterized protein n=1 Tax=Cavenderia fasciculata TaxID=261658 RepID=F4PMU7_CACFS|nr:hypothetical protein DFA_05825 [Cavenderia fasciculata]EGG23691.1 hypothetical protein DFA_05825 [Cavenderia fasciculata]|eukprot:XP_004361542.1 hypothetical protein DFA_05825 [Cavenderia fasciculata]